MKNLTLNQIRSTFLNYFKENNHELVSSSPLVPHNDPSLMFTNAGMIPFKDMFTGAEKRNYTRATSSQKIVRAGGKHNDLENVGYTARHHTFFEMLGNFSFGDYFKEESIFYAWDLLINILQLPKERLYITVYYEDKESALIWKKITGFSDDKIIKISTNDNFWSMGDTGPCGPCSEIFYDHGESIAGGLPGTPEEDGDRYMEISNLVFMQYEQLSSGGLVDLPSQSIDTGMGLERIASVLQGVHNNFDTDLFQNIISNAEEIIGVKAIGEQLFSYRVIADHLRASAHLIADGVMPSNEGRGYVLRRIMRRAMRHAHQLGAKDPMMYKLIPTYKNLVGDVFDELARGEEFISNILKQEEVNFKTTLDRGLSILKQESKNLSKGSKLSGDVAFKLYDTYGFPLDLTQDILRKDNMIVDHDRFNECMEEQKNRARASWTGSGETKTSKIWFDILARDGVTEFLGYNQLKASGEILSIIHQGKEIEEFSILNEEFTIITNQTVFYGESGGQMGDIGYINTVNSEIEVIDTKKYLGKIIGHICKLKKGSLKLREVAKLSVNEKYRNNLRIHHSATHIVHATIREILGNHVVQKGSLVAHDRLRFDIGHPQAITQDEIRAIELKVNQIIMKNYSANTVIMDHKEAISKGAIALFGEKYDDKVRVVSFELPSNSNSYSSDKQEEIYSTELCGGTHVNRTGDIGLFKITNETAVSAGVRRIEAICGEFALREFIRQEDLLQSFMQTLKCSYNELADRVNILVSQKRELEKEIAKLSVSQLVLSKENIEKKSLKISNIKLIIENYKNIDRDIMRQAIENTIKKVDDTIILCTSESDEKISIICVVSKNISQTRNAGKILAQAAEFLGGKGGGSPTLAQGGGTDLSKIDQLKGYITNLLT